MENTFDYLYTAAELGEHELLPELKEENQIQILPQQSIIFWPIPPGGYTALHIAAYNGHKTFVERLLALYGHEGSLDIEGRHNFLKVGDAYKNNTALHEAVRGGDHPDIVRLLLEADPTLANGHNNDCETPLFIAAENGHLKAVKELLPETHPPYERSDGRTPLHHAMHGGHYEVVKTLLETHKLMVKAEDIEGRTVLHVAALIDGCPEEVIQQLLEPDISFCYKKDNINQRTALHIAAERGNVGFVRCILRIARRSAEIVDKDGRHALHLAVEKGDVDTVKELLKFMPRLINVLDKKGCTALDIATALERVESADYRVEVMRTLVDHNGRRGVRKAQTLSRPGIQDAIEQSSRHVEEQRVVTKPQTLPESGIPERDSDQINALSVTSVLIATLSFQAFIQPPGGVSEEGLPVLANNPAFKHFMVANALAFFLSMFVAITLVGAVIFSAPLPPDFQHFKKFLTRNFNVGLLFLVDTALWCMISCFIIAGDCYGINHTVFTPALLCMIIFFWAIFVGIPYALHLWKDIENWCRCYYLLILYLFNGSG